MSTTPLEESHVHDESQDRSSSPTTSPMKVGFGTVLWGRRIDDLDYMLNIVSACGYAGIELAQHHEQIFVRNEDGTGIRQLRGIDELLEKLKSKNLELIGVVGGTLQERIDFLGENRAPYLYIDRWPGDDQVDDALNAGFTVAVHPHWLMPIPRMKEWREYSGKFLSHEKNDQLRLLLDIAHAVVAENDPVAAIRKNSAKLAAVHVKDWKPDYGRWSHRYAHGFCLPGEGIVPITEAMDTLRDKSYQGWVILEQDHYNISREQTALQSAQWLEKEGHQWGIPLKPQPEKVRELISQCHVNPFYESLGKARLEEYVMGVINGTRKTSELFDAPFSAQVLSGPLSELMLGRQLSRRVSHDPDSAEFYQIISQTVRRLLGSECLKIWSYNPLMKNDEFCLLGVDCCAQLDPGKCETVISDQKSLAGGIICHPCIHQFDLRVPEVAEGFSDKRWLTQLQSIAPWLIVLPVFNTSNTHQLRYLLTCASKEPLLSVDNPAKGTFHLEHSKERLGQLEAISWIIAHWADYLTDEICSKEVGHTNHLCGVHLTDDVTSFVDKLADHLTETFQCNQVTVFLEDITGERLVPVGKSVGKLVWHCDPPHCYTKDDDKHFTWRAWQDRQMVFSRKATEGKAREIREGGDDRNEILFAPLLRRLGHCYGVIRLHNKKRPDNRVSSMFSDDDASKLDAIIQTALPHLELLKMQEGQTQMIARMVHEFQAPMVAIRGAVDLMKTDLEKRGEQPNKFFRRDFLDDVLNWTELMGRLTRNAKIYAAGAQSEDLRPRRTNLLGQVVMPVLRQIRPLVPESVRLITRHEDLESIPPLYLDRNQMMQVFFNLLSNSIKYGGSKELVRVTITGGLMGANYAIFYQDWGLGIEEKDREEVFQPGFRGERAKHSTVTGLGLGLYVVRSIVKAHGGSITVRSCRNPTTFEINLPARLRSEPPRPIEKKPYE